MSDIGKTAAGKPQKGMLHFNSLLRRNAVVVFHQQVKIFPHDSGGRILNGQHCIICLPAADGLHGVPPGFHMVTVNLFPEISFHGKLAVSTFRPLIHHFVCFKGQAVHLGKSHIPPLTVLNHHLILTPAAQRHNLLKKLSHAVAVLFRLHQAFDFFQFLFFPGLIQHRLSHRQFIFCNFSCQPHSGFIQSRNLTVYFINFLPDFT